MDYTRVIELDPTNSHAYHNRGISYDKIGDFEKAIADFTKVLELESGHERSPSGKAGAALQHRLAAMQKTTENSGAEANGFNKPQNQHQYQQQQYSTTRYAAR